MLKKVFSIFGFALLFLTVVNCAKRGTPMGGPQDLDPPVFVNSNPPNYSTNFDSEEIRITFDELIKLKELQKNLIISPPIEPKPPMTPLGSAAKYISIDVGDSLIPNTTYVFNFGNSVVDNNEGNPFTFFKYVMSTGDYIDSLTVKGQIRDALQQKPDEFVTVMLYEMDSTYTDSTIFKSVPRYVTNTLDSSTTFEITNLRAGKYRLAALKDESSNYTFQPEKDKVAFLDQVIEVPTDSSYTLTLFMEEPPMKVGRPVQTRQQRVAFPFTGNRDSIKIDLLNERPEGFESLVTYTEGQDSLRYWYKPQIERDSLIFKIKTGKKQDTFYLRKRPARPDSLFFTAPSRGTLRLNSPFLIESTIPILSIDSTKIQIIRQDSIAVDFSTELFPKTASLNINFKTEQAQNYRIMLLPEALTDFYGATNDTLIYEPKTKEVSDYSDLILTLVQANSYPYIVQLVTETGTMVREQYAKEGQVKFKFDLVEPGKYYARLILDKNANMKYDTGNYLDQRQPEAIVYYPQLLDLRTGFFVEISFDLSQAVTDLPVEKDPDPIEN